MHARLDFTLEGCADDEGLNLFGDLLHYTPSHPLLERDQAREGVITNPPWEMVEQIPQHFDICLHTTPTSTLAVLVAKINTLTRHCKLRHEFPARTQQITR
jgi:hypothetical protein